MSTPSPVVDRRTPTRSSVQQDWLAWCENCVMSTRNKALSKHSTKSNVRLWSKMKIIQTQFGVQRQRNKVGSIRQHATSHEITKRNLPDNKVQNWLVDNCRNIWSRQRGQHKQDPQTSKPKGRRNSASSSTEENIKGSGHRWTTCMRQWQQTKTKLHMRPYHAPWDKLMTELATDHGGHV